MHSGSKDDLTTKARIRQAAVDCFAREGFSVSVRAISEHAGVSPGLIIHHFGSKARLRGECDAHVRRFIAGIKTETVEGFSGTSMLQQLAEVEQYASVLGYVVRSLQSGGALAADLFELTVEDVERFLAVGEEAGTIAPSRAPAARARYLTSSSLGSLMLHTTLHHPGHTPDFRRVVQEWIAEYMFPALESYTEPVFTDRTLLDTCTPREGGTGDTGGGAGAGTG
ncbi:TetR/AcrR family transcriptional regulator [Nocardiopsis kunsanensis]|uniref:TetR family transcriptional regulator n=1 Tax=Nocardiopsis kunsanensis TaxID=141693 RepID=A0A919CFM4_9ACTN|nr:TetR family transcriptional regulator [Nocardiopsis kunsanensis]GHD17990.1 TetR family transcriptional regulator [Nocardiopsis kunsanensis]